VSWADGAVNDLNQSSQTAPDFGIYLYDPKTGKNSLIYNDRSTWDLAATPVAIRKEPPVIGDLQRAPDASQPVRIGSINVREGPSDRGLLERGRQGRHDVRSHDARGRRCPR
jgi:hypothetical protein